MNALPHSARTGSPNRADAPDTAADVLSAFDALDAIGVIGVTDPIDPLDRVADDPGADDDEEELRTRPLMPRRASVPDPGDAVLVGWIARVAERDERALAALYDATLSRVHGLVLRVVRQAAMADEVVEDTYFQVWRQALRYDPQRGSALAWLLGMARTRAIDALRREARFQHDSLDEDNAPEIEDEQPQADALLDAARGHADLHRALMQLNPQPRQLVALAFFSGLSHEEIASQTALPLGTVKSQIRRALLALRQRLGDHGLHALA